MRLRLLEEVAQAPVVEAEYQYEGQQEEAELNLAADPALRGIYESGLRPIPVVPVESVEAFVASVSSTFRSNRFCLLCLSLSTAAETKLRQQLAGKKVSYPDSRVSRFNDSTIQRCNGNEPLITSHQRVVCLRRQWIRAWKYLPGHFSSGNNP
jgi:hypothetical protein